MNTQFMFENGKGSVVDEYGQPEPMDYIVDEEQFRFETLSSHTQYLAQLALKGEKEIETMQEEKEVVKPCSDVIVRETSVKRNYTRYCDQDKVRFFKLLFEKCLSAAAAAKQHGIHVCIAQKWAKQYDIIFKKRRKTGRPHEVMKKLKQIFTELKVPKTILFDFVKQHCNLSLKKARLLPIDRNSEDKIQERLDWVREREKTDMDFTRNSR
ncbi:hypothetical protein BD408DRAFT_433758 [Parasitella parasitica]|nr:hypothetical protein BD408DRAFT_433758 [Parasitella parasitica]